MYDKEFKVMICELLLSGQRAKTLSEEYDVDAHLIRSWKRQYVSGKEVFTGEVTHFLKYSNLASALSLHSNTDESDIEKTNT